MDAIKNFAKVTVSTGYSSTDTSIALSSGEGSKLPDPSSDGAYNLVWYNFTDYPDPSDDPNVEIVRCTARSTDTLTITRGQEGTTASNKNTSGKTYKMMLTVTKKTMDDIDSHITNTSNPHSVTTSQIGAVDKTTNQTIAGVKTFSSIPVLPSSDPTSDNQAARKSYVDDMAQSGVGEYSITAYTPTTGSYQLVRYTGTQQSLTYLTLQTSGTYQYYIKVTKTGTYIVVAATAQSTADGARVYSYVERNVAGTITQCSPTYIATFGNSGYNSVAATGMVEISSTTDSYIGVRFYTGSTNQLIASNFTRLFITRVGTDD